MGIPSCQEQSDFWSQWIARSRQWEHTDDNVRRARRVMTEISPECRRFIDVGCGSGWFALNLAQLGEVTATDIAGEAIDNLRLNHPEVTWLGGDFLEMDWPNHYYDFASCMEVVAHVPDQRKFAECLARLLRPGGTLVLTSQNPYIWSRSRALKKPGPGQIRNWPSRARLMELFSPWFEIRTLTTCAPSGDAGLPGFLSRRRVSAAGKGIFGEERWLRMLESLGFGRSLVLVGVRKTH